MENKLYRDEFRKKIAGVCAGLSDYLNIDVAIVRLIFVLMLIFHGGGLLIYIVFWIALPKRPYLYNDPKVDYTVPPQNPGAQANDPYTNNPYGGNTFQGGTFGNNPFPNSPFPNTPFQPERHRGTPLFAIIFGVVLIVVGGSILLDNLNIIPDWDLRHLWPIILITVGCVLMLTGNHKKPWEIGDLPGSAKTSADPKTDDKATSEDTPPADTPPVA